MNYDEVRPLLETGDVIGVKRKDGTLAKLTQHFTESDYTHIGIILKMTNGVWMAELNSGRNHLIPLSQLQDMQFDVYDPPSCLNRSHIRAAILRWLRFPVEYGFIAFVCIGLMDYFNIKFPVLSKNILVCSGYIVRIFQTAGWDERISPFQSPAELLKMLHLKFKVNQAG